ncbi:hypothetical protein [Streptomyces sp. SCL15-4]|uniref:hypothetical protein n=1 Tax=Streptomyces sp. SCL15-4 TaxID=2967221 RepID=UPI0029663C96|nr:hypothetical protein [Streptomyces sp. SCL15-4]
MGRTSGALVRHTPVETLAQWLESLRRRSGTSWDQMARIAVASGLPATRSTLYRAARGEALPKWRTVQAFTRVCGGDEREAKRLWTAAARHEAADGGAAPRVTAPPPRFITEPWQLVHAMREMCRENGHPTLRELEERAYIDIANKVSLLPKSTLGAVLRGRMPARDLLLNFVRYCGNVPESRLGDWADAWDRVHALHGHHRAPRPRAGRRARAKAPTPTRPRNSPPGPSGTATASRTAPGTRRTLSASSSSFRAGP